MCSFKDGRISESSFSRIFLDSLIDGNLKKAFPKFQAIYGEAAAPQGVADFIGIAGGQWNRTRALLVSKLHDLPKGPTSEILASLSLIRPVSLDFVLSKLTFSRPACLTIWNRLVRTGIIEEQRSGKFLLKIRLLAPSSEIYFFELKLDKWRRALRQAIQAKQYADRPYVVFPAAKSNVLKKNAHIFRQHRVGVLLLDPITGEVTKLVRPKKSKSYSLRHKLLLLLGLANVEPIPIRRSDKKTNAIELSAAGSGTASGPAPLPVGRKHGR